MKTIEIINAEIQELKDQREKLLEEEKSVPLKIKRRLKELQYLIVYLNTNPSEEGCKNQLSIVEKRLNAFNERYLPWVEENRVKIGKKNERETRKYYNQLFDVKKLELQVKTLRYLLK